MIDKLIRRVPESCLLPVRTSLGRQEPDFGQNKSHLLWSEHFLCHWNIVEPEFYLKIFLQRDEEQNMYSFFEIFRPNKKWAGKSQKKQKSIWTEKNLAEKRFWFIDINQNYIKKAIQKLNKDRNMYRSFWNI